MDPGAAERAGTTVPSLGEVFRRKGFRALFVANCLSLWGDYVAQITIASVVYTRTGSALATAATFTVSMMPKLLGRGLLSGLADRLPYRDVLVHSHLARAVLAMVLVVGVFLDWPIPVLLVALFVLELCAGPAVAAGQVLLTEWFPDRALYARALAVNNLSSQVNQAVGFVLGGSIVALTGHAPAMLFDVATFVAVAVVVVAVVPSVVPSGASTGKRLTMLADLRTGWASIAANPVLLALLALSVAAMPAVVVPEAVAIPYAAHAGWSAGWQGVLLAAPVTGAFVGIVAISRIPGTRQTPLMTRMAVCMPLPLMLTILHPPAVLLWLAWFTSGALQAFMLPLQASFALVAPVALRGRLFGLAGAISVAGSGLAYLAAGWIAGRTQPAASVGVCAVASLALIVLARAMWPREAVDRAVDAAYAGEGPS